MRDGRSEIFEGPTEICTLLDVGVHEAVFDDDLRKCFGDNSLEPRKCLLVFFWYEDKAPAAKGERHDVKTSCCGQAVSGLLGDGAPPFLHDSSAPAITDCGRVAHSAFDAREQVEAEAKRCGDEDAGRAES